MFKLIRLTFKLSMSRVASPRSVQLIVTFEEAGGRFRSDASTKVPHAYTPPSVQVTQLPERRNRNGMYSLGWLFMAVNGKTHKYLSRALRRFMNALKVEVPEGNHTNMNLNFRCVDWCEGIPWPGEYGKKNSRTRQ